MSSAILKAGAQSKAGPGLSGSTPNSQAILLDKLNRGATPDSEALASSDDEGDTRQDQPPPSVQQHKPVRRASWLNDTSQTASRPRKGSFASSSMSPTASHPSTPSVESGVGAWGSHPAPTAVLGRAHTASSTFPWGTAIWNTERKEPPSRLSEVLPSPTSLHPPGSGSSLFASSDLGQSQTSPGPRDPPNSQIPFAIPLHPTPKTYRSQSYSVGQLEPDATAGSMGPSAILGGRSRALPHSGLQHRPSRPSMLSEMSNEGMLGKVKEVDDDDEESSESLQGSQHQTAESKTIELLARENAMLRQQQQQQYQHNARLRPRASTGYGLGNGYGLHAPVPEESDFAVDELDESHDGSEVAARRALGRRMSEYGAGAPHFRSPFTVENRKLENVKKAFWQSSLGFPGLGELPQSRRHSFADVPQRQASISSLGEQALGHESISQESQPGQDFGSPFSDNSSFPATHPASYFTGGVNIASSQQQVVGQSAFGGPYSSYALHAPFSNRPASPHRAMYGITQPNRSTPLHVVLFKCARADVFYIQEGTGLTVKPGDLVIVEADRGTDLGTVAADNVDWIEAKRQKEHYAEEHYKWLMMYSQNAGVAQDGVGAGLMAASNGLQGGAVGGMGPPPGQHHMQEPNAGELKPKLIKRLAQNHEIHALRDKEGNEAKAKRVCMQKVKEHGLNMEILDAEFQMDWKKLTFYYFADSYINFNSLVTDLFKIYKTRIWMSAINPASFASQPLGLQAPSGIGPGAVVIGRGGGANAERRPNPQAESQVNRSFQAPNAAFPQQFGSERPLAPGTAYAAASGYQYAPYAAFAGTNRVTGVSYAPAMVPSVDTYTASFQPGVVEYSTMRARLSTPQSAGGGQHDQGMSPLTTTGDIAGAFQGLSLNSR